MVRRDGAPLDSSSMSKVYALLDIAPDARTAITYGTLAVSFGIAEQLYKFHSFTLETLAFLGTWWALRRVGLLFVRR